MQSQTCHCMPRVNRRLVDGVCGSFHLARGSHVAKLGLDRTVHVHWTLIRLSTLILGRSFWKLPLTRGIYFPVIYHVSNADWFVPFIKHNQHASVKIDKCNHLNGPRDTRCHVSSDDWAAIFSGLYELTHGRHVADFDRTVHLDWDSVIERSWIILMTKWSEYFGYYNKGRTHAC